MWRKGMEEKKRKGHILFMHVLLFTLGLEESIDPEIKIEG